MFGFNFMPSMPNMSGSDASSSTPTLFPAAPAEKNQNPNQKQVASDALDTYIDSMMQDPNMNVRAIPDPIEKFLYKRMIPGFMRCSKWILGMMLQRIILGQIAGRLGGKFGILKKLM